MANRLAQETSPYLRQHADNPVDWYAWSPDAFERARREDKPVLLSVGYAACHWCHVMAHESFEDPATAALMNERFVNIKVDREERPDVDGIYMQAVQAMTGHGGWPMTMFLTPAGEPFYGGTYFPPQDRHGLPSFTRVLRSVAEAYHSRRDDLEQTTRRLRALYDAVGAPAESTGELTAATLDRAYASIEARYDVRNGGFEGAPKFPMTMVLDFALRYAHRHKTPPTIALESFRHMAHGGIYDQLGGGFHRYSVDAMWLVPHFEKMLYDNALLARLGVHLWQATGDAEVRAVTERTLDWVAREMTDPSGGFYASLDADSAGGEGNFYIWRADEIDDPDIKSYYGVTELGNFEGANVLHVANPNAATPLHVERARAKLFARRAERERPARDEKILASWNGLMLRAMADAARAFGRADYRALALANGDFLARTMLHPDGRVMRSHAYGVTKIDGFLEDYAAVGLGFLALYELTFDARWLAKASFMTVAIERNFWDDSHRMFFDTARDADPLIVRPRDVTDNAVPSGTSLATELYLHLAELTGNTETRGRADWVLSTLVEPMTTHAPAFGYLLGVADAVVNGSLQVALVGETETLANVVATSYAPSLVLAGGASDVELLRDRATVDGRPTAYVCRGFVCDRPVTEPKDLKALLSHA
jgi:uncharacterized protein